MHTANKQGGLEQYLYRCLIALMPAYLVAYVLSRMKESPSLLEQYEASYLLFHALFLLLSLVLSRKILLRGQWWQIIPLGMISGIFATCFALPLATVIALDDGANRIADSYLIADWIQTFSAHLLFSLYNFAWVLGAVVFSVVKWLIGPVSTKLS